MKTMRVVSIAATMMLVMGICYALVAHAQDATTDLSLTTMPLDPQPLQQVTITAHSYGTDLSQDNLTWNYNGKQIAVGTGRTQVTVTAPASGLTGTVTVSISGTGITNTSASLSLRPASVDVLWEGAGSYTPPFYKGRALPSRTGIINVVAIPSASAPKSLSYTWSENDDVLQSASGYNKSSIKLQNDTLTNIEHVSVTESNGGFSGTSAVDITPGSTNLVGYISTDGYIDYANGSASALGTDGTGTIVHFEPYFFSTPTSMAHDLTFSYTDNAGNAIDAGDSANELRLSKPDGGGTSFFTVAVGTVAYTLQNISRQFSINFN